MPDERYDSSIERAIELLVDANADLLAEPHDSSFRLKRVTFASHITNLVRETDRRDHRKLPLEQLAKWCGIQSTPMRGLMGRHPLVPRIQPVRAALELQDARSGVPRAGIIKVFGGTRNTTILGRGIHRSENATTGRQLHLEFVVITDEGRSILVNTERYAFGDVTWDAARAAATAAIGKARAEGITSSALLGERWRHAIATHQRETWGEHATGRSPETVAEHIRALLGAALEAAELVGVPDLYSDLPIVGGQLVAATKAGMLPSPPLTSLISHDIASIEQLIEFGVLPVLDLNAVDGTALRGMDEVPFTIKLPRADGEAAPHKGHELLALLSDPQRATPVPREELDVRDSLGIAVTYVDGEIDLVSGPRSVRVYYRASRTVPHSLYLVPMVPGDIDTHRTALAAIVLDSTSLHMGPQAPIAILRDTCERKGAFDPGGEGAIPAEGLATIARLAADRELHRKFSEPPARFHRPAAG